MRKKSKVAATDKDRNRIKELWPGMTLTEKISYILSYYVGYIVAALLIILAGIFFYKNFTSPKDENAFYVMAIEQAGTKESDIDRMEEDLSDLFSLDPSHQSVLIETGYGDDTNYQNEATIFTYMQSGRVDLIIAPEDVFNKYAASGYLADLDDGYKSFLDGYTVDKLFYATVVDYSEGGPSDDIDFAPHDDSGDAQCFGIYLGKGTFAGNVIGVMINAPHEKYLKTGLEYFINE